MPATNRLRQGAPTVCAKGAIAAATQIGSEPLLGRCILQAAAEARSMVGGR